MAKGDVIWNNESIRIVATEKCNDYVVEYMIGYDATGAPTWKAPSSSTEFNQLNLLISTLGNKLGAVLSRMKGKENG